MNSTCRSNVSHITRIQFDEFIDEFIEIIKCYNKIAYQIEWKSKIKKLNVDVEVLETILENLKPSSKNERYMQI